MNPLKKFARIAAITAALAITATITTFAVEFPCTGYSTGDSLNIRSGPDTIYGTYGQINTGDAVQLIGQEGNWYKISTPLAACGYAYISAEYITTTAPAQVRSVAPVIYGGTSGNVSAGQRVV